MNGPRISYVDPASIAAAMLAELNRCGREGTARRPSRAGALGACF